MIATRGAAREVPDMGSWPWWMVTGGVLFLIGGPSHPNADPALPEPLGVAQEIGDPSWIPSHAFFLAGAIGFVIGLFALARNPGLPFSVPARRWAWIAGSLGVLYIAESVFHLFAFVDHDELLAGEATPVLDVYLVMASLVRPPFFIALAVFAVLSASAVTHPLTGVLGALGAISFGIAPLLTAPGPALIVIEPLEVLYPIGAITMSAWFIVTGISGLIRLQRAPKVTETVRS